MGGWGTNVSRKRSLASSLAEWLNKQNNKSMEFSFGLVCKYNAYH
jgi:phage-related protein